jgi:hypothetical protein
MTGKIGGRGGGEKGDQGVFAVAMKAECSSAISTDHTFALR